MLFLSIQHRGGYLSLFEIEFEGSAHKLASRRKAQNGIRAKYSLVPLCQASVWGENRCLKVGRNLGYMTQLSPNEVTS
jgi:hypothetical protein